ncbi:Uncharacterised protein [Vibrio cholerae]|nr:Uncharacterised protein [Vibrio cholerae]CSC61131.1 Uncharacterised protein [Vibrio cholerae]
MLLLTSATSFSACAALALLCRVPLSASSTLRFSFSAFQIRQARHPSRLILSESLSSVHSDSTRAVTFPSAF